MTSFSRNPRRTQSHGILQSSLEENFAEIRRLNKVVRQLQALLIERDHARVTTAAISPPPPPHPHQHHLAVIPAVVTPPTPPGMDYLPTALHAPTMAGRSRSHFELFSTTGMPPLTNATTGTTARVYGPLGMGTGSAMLPMLRSQSDYGYRFPVCSDASMPPLYGFSSTPTTAEFVHSLNYQARYAPPFNYHQQQQEHQADSDVDAMQEGGPGVLSISPAQLSPGVPPLSSHRGQDHSMTWSTSSLLAPRDYSGAAACTEVEAGTTTPFSLPLPLGFADPIPASAAAAAASGGGLASLQRSAPTCEPPRASASAVLTSSASCSTSPHSLKFDAAVTLAKGLAANRAFAFDSDNGLHGMGRGEEGPGHRQEVDGNNTNKNYVEDEDDEDLYAFPIPPLSSDCAAPTSFAATQQTPVDLAQLATMALSGRASVEPVPDADRDLACQSVFSVPPTQRHESLVSPPPPSAKGGEGGGYRVFASTHASSVATAVTPTGHDLPSPPHPVSVVEGSSDECSASPVQRDSEDPESWLFRLPQH